MLAQMAALGAVASQVERQLNSCKHETLERLRADLEMPRATSIAGIAQRLCGGDL